MDFEILKNQRKLISGKNQDVCKQIILYADELKTYTKMFNIPFNLNCPMEKVLNNYFIDR